MSEKIFTTKKHRECFTFLFEDEQLIGKRLEIQATRDGKDWALIPRGAPNSNSDESNDTDINDWRFDSVPTLIDITDLFYKEVRVVFYE